MPAIATPRVVWAGPAAWIEVAYDAPLGHAVTYVGPMSPAIATPALAQAVGERVRRIVDRASEHVGQVVGATKCCARCTRTLMRSALGSPVDAAAVMLPQPGDIAKYAAAWKALGPSVRAAQVAMGRVRMEAVRGYVRADDVEMTGAAALYQQGGWPLKAGQFTDYKLCACGNPTDAASKPTMLVDL